MDVDTIIAAWPRASRKAANIILSEMPAVIVTGRAAGDPMSEKLEARYQQALIKAGGIPLTLPATVSREVIAESVSRCDGVLMTGGEDVEPSLYARGVPAKVNGFHAGM